MKRSSLRALADFVWVFKSFVGSAQFMKKQASYNNSAHMKSFSTTQMNKQEEGNWLSNVVNELTAHVTNDFEKRKQMIEPRQYRARARLVLTLIMGGLLAGAVVILAQNLPDRKVVKRDYDSKSFPQAVHMEELNIGDITCPCSRNRTCSWSEFITYSVTDSRNGSKNYILDNNTTNYICNWNSTDERDYICRASLAILVNDGKAQNIIDSPILLGLYDVRNHVLATIKSNIRVQKDIFHYLKSGNQELYNYSINMMNLMNSMIDEQLDLPLANLTLGDSTTGDSPPVNSYGRIPVSDNSKVVPIDKKNPTDPGLIDASMKAEKSQTNDSSPINIKMSINWRIYASKCEPKYCEIIEYYTILSRLLSATAMVGGFLSITLFFVRVLVWPCLAQIMNYLRG